MKKDNKKYSSLQIFILSLIFAIAIWVVVGVVNDPDIRHTITSLPIHYVGTEELTENNLVIVSENDKVSTAFTVSGKRRDLIKYGKEAYVSIDVSGISHPGEYTLKGVPQLSNSKINIVREKTVEVEVTAEVLTQKEVPVEVKLVGTPKNQLIKATPQSDKISVSGAKSEIEELEKALLTIDVSKITEPTAAYAEVKLCSEFGSELNKASTLTAAAEVIEVDLSIYEKKSLPIKLKLNEELESKYYLDSDRSSMEKPTVDVGVLPGYDIECVYADINSSAGESAEFYLIEEEGMYIPESQKSLVIKPDITTLVSKHMDISVKAENVPEGKTADFSDTVTNVLLVGTDEFLDNSDIHFIIDLKDLSDGSHRVKAKLSDDRIQVDNDIIIDVEIH